MSYDYLHDEDLAPQEVARENAARDRADDAMALVPATLSPEWVERLKDMRVPGMATTKQRGQRVELRTMALGRIVGRVGGREWMGRWFDVPVFRVALEDGTEAFVDYRLLTSVVEDTPASAPQGASANPGE